MLMPERDRQRHTYVLGKSGSGKSELLKLLVYGYLRKPGSATVVVIDPHGDLAEEIARFKEHRKSDRLIYIDPYLDGIGGRMPTINPFELRDTGPQAIDIAAVAGRVPASASPGVQKKKQARSAAGAAAFASSPGRAASAPSRGCPVSVFGGPCARVKRKSSSG